MPTKMVGFFVPVVKNPYVCSTYGKTDYDSL